jgi:hypothetical protein
MLTSGKMGFSWTKDGLHYSAAKSERPVLGIVGGKFERPETEHLIIIVQTKEEIKRCASFEVKDHKVRQLTTNSKKSIFLTKTPEVGKEEFMLIISDPEFILEK